MAIFLCTALTSSAEQDSKPRCYFRRGIREIHWLGIGINWSGREAGGRSLPGIGLFQILKGSPVRFVDCYENKKCASKTDSRIDQKCS